MKNKICPLLAAMMVAIGLAGAHTCASASDLGYRVQFSTPSQEGGFDYVSVEQSSGRVFVGRSFGVEVFESGHVKTVLERKGVASVLQVGQRLLLTTNRSMDSVTIMDRVDNRVLAEITTVKSPDGAVYDEASGRAFVMTGGSKDITVIDVVKRLVVAKVAVGATPEGGVVDGLGRLYVNLEETNEIAVIDIASSKVVARYALNGCDEPTGLARDPASGILAAACRNGVLKFIDARDGRDRGQLEIGKGADSSIFDAARRIGFVPCLDGTLTIYRLGMSGEVTTTQRLTTRVGARTAAYDTQRDELYVAVADVERDAQGGYLRARQNFQILTISPDASSR